MKKLQGTARPDRMRGKSVNAKRMPKRPTGLSEQAVRIWKSLGPKLHELGLLAEIDASTFAIYCQAFGDWLQLTRYLNRLGPLKWYSVTKSGYRRTIPELQVRDRAFQVLLKLGTRFGLDPSSREGLGVANQTSPDFAEEFLFKPL
jgi:P27 family predicted phage terminase small subunit